MQAHDRIALALDVPTRDEARDWARRMSGRVGTFKIGLRLFTACGPSLVEEIAGHGPVFLDLKYHDIPNTVASAVREAAALGVRYLTVHASGGDAMLKAASEAADAGARAGTPAPMVLAVTMLTSLAQDDLATLGIARTVEDQVVALAEMAWMAGCAGIVASPRELAPLRRRLGASPILVAPGIRAAGAPKDDQARTASAAEAVAAGASMLVIGRPILESADPDAALEAILGELRG